MLAAGLYGRLDVDNAFDNYLDYLLHCIVNPDFPEFIKGDRTARKRFDEAVHKIEIDELARWRYGTLCRDNVAKISSMRYHEVLPQPYLAMSFSAGLLGSPAAPGLHQSKSLFESRTGAGCIQHNLGCH